MNFNPTKVLLNSFSILSKILSAHCGQILAQEVGKIVQKNHSVTISDFFLLESEARNRARDRLGNQGVDSNLVDHDLWGITLTFVH